MSARKRVHGNTAVWCDVDGCESVWVAQGWWVDAPGARRQALVMGWTRRLDGSLQWADFCPTHSTVREPARCTHEGGEWPGLDRCADCGQVTGSSDSTDPCPEWHCSDLSSEDRREGRTCPEHPCTCSSDPS